jgi:hemoglobin
MQPGEGTTPFELIGGDAQLRALVDKFYDLMDSEPEYDVIRKLHPGDLGSSRDKLHMFFSGWMGGPPLYVEKFGHPMLRARHLPFPIGIAERDAWLACMAHALRECATEEKLAAFLLQQFKGTADWMRNREG